MNTAIFATHAPTYWSAGLPVIPLGPRTKKPDILQWSTYSSQMPTQLEMQHWLASFSRGNIGLPLGPASGLAMIDIDTEDQDLIDAILDILPPSPWVRVGKKGMALAYRFEGQKNFKLRGSEGGMILEFLGVGNQVVLPPSIHPETQQPYTASANLWDVLDKVPYLGEDIEDKLRALLDKKGFSIGAGGRSSPIDLVPAGERDVQMVRHAGYLARVVLGIDKSLKFSLVEALGHMHHWVANYTIKVSGDAMDPEKGVAKLLEFLAKDVEKGRTMPDGWDNGLTEELRAHPVIAKMIEINTVARWDVVRARDWLIGQVLENPDDAGWYVNRVMELVGEVAKDDNFSEFEFRTLITFILDRGGKKFGLKKSDLLVAYHAAKKGQESGEVESHLLIARKVLEELEKYGEIRFDQGQFWQWSGSCFKPYDGDELYMRVANMVDNSMLVRRHSDYASVVQVLERMCKGDLIRADGHGLNFANGFVRDDLTIVSHDPIFGATFTLPFEYTPDKATSCPKFMAFLANCWGHEPDYQERVMALQEMFAVTLLKMAPAYQHAFLLFGRASTGKTVLLKILRALLPPDAVANLGPQLWDGKFHLTDLIGKAANIVGELPENGVISGNVFKEVVEGNAQRTEFKGRDAFNFVPQCAHWFASNYLPQSRDSSRGFDRRWLILDFNKPVADKDKVTNLAEIIVAEERDAIAAWALDGLRRVVTNEGFTEPACHAFRLCQMRRINNSVQAFLEDSSAVEFGEGEMKAQKLYDTYVEHVRNYRRGQIVTFERFMQMVEDLDLSVVRDTLNDYIVCGVRPARKEIASAA